MLGATAEEAHWKGTFEVTLSLSVLRSHDGCFSAAGLAKDEDRSQRKPRKVDVPQIQKAKEHWFAQVWEENPL